MQKFNFLVIAAVVSMSMTCSLQAESPLFHQFHEPTCCCRNDCCRPLWSVNAGAVILHRSTPQPSLIIETWNGSARLLDASAFKFGWNSGVDIGVVRRVDKCNAFDAIDFRYFGVESWQANASIATPLDTDWRFPRSIGTFSPAQIDAAYRSQLHSAEINFLCDSSYERLTWLAGFRWIELDEQLNIGVDLLPLGKPKHYIYTTRNNLYGGQIGALIKLLDRKGLQIDCSSKVGLYGNVAANRCDLRDYHGIYHLLSSDRRSPVSFVGDIGLTGVYQVTKHIALRGGYQLLWIQGVAIAGDQPMVADPVTHNGIRSGGGVFYHGALASVNFTW